MTEEHSFNRLIVERYEIKHLIGTGGMSHIYLAMDRHLHKEWAIKEIKKITYDRHDEQIVNVLLAEVELLKCLEHPALPRIIDIIEEKDSFFIVMDYIPGESLDRILQREYKIPQETVVEWAIQLCEVLEYLHSQTPPIIYRDMKPGNIMRKPDGSIKLIDFGIAREYKEKSRTDTMALGTRGYAPPEQHGIRQTDVRSDIYALGMTLHHLLTGVDPRTPGYVYYPIRHWNVDLSGGLEAIIDKCTAFAPEARYQNCKELRCALEHYESAGVLRRQKIRKRIGSGILILLLGALIWVWVVVQQNEMQRKTQEQYEQKLEISASTDYQTKVDTYLSAMELCKGDMRAYRKLLDTYQEQAVFGETQSHIFLEKYNEYQALFDKESQEYAELLYQIGLLYFYFYSGGDGTFRTRILMAYPYFEEIVERQPSDTALLLKAKHYEAIGSFYKQYVIENMSVREPTREHYEELLTSLAQCLCDVEQYQGEESAYLQLTMYREIFYLLHEQRKGLALTGTDKGEVLDLLSDLAEKTDELTVTQEKSLAIQQTILSLYETYAADIERSYTNTEKWEKQEKRKET